MNNHQSLKAEIDARAENFSICVNLGKDLLHRRHPRSEEVRLLHFISLFTMWYIIFGDKVIYHVFLQICLYKASFFTSRAFWHM